MNERNNSQFHSLAGPPGFEPGSYGSEGHNNVTEPFNPAWFEHPFTVTIVVTVSKPVVPLCTLA